MKPAKLDLPTIWRGCDWPVVTLNWKDANGDPFDLTNWIPIAWTNGFTLNAAVIVPASSGVTQMSMDHVTTSTLKLGVYQWNWIWQHTAAPLSINVPTLYGSVEVKNPITPL